MAAKPKFQLRKPNSDSETLILLVYRFGENKFVYSTGESIHPDYWDNETQRAKTDFPKDKVLHEKMKSINFQLERYQLKIAEVLSSLKLQKVEISIDRLKEEMDKEFIKKPVVKKLDLFGFIENFIKNVKFTRGNNPKPMGEKTKIKYGITFKILKEFAQEEKRGKLDFKDINMDFYSDFIVFMQTKYNHTPNTIGKNIKVLKLFLREAKESGLEINPTFENRKFSAMSENVEKIYLKESEVDKLWNLDLENSKRLDTVRDLFIIGCCTALRYSDFTNIKPENIVETSNGRALKIKTQKTNQIIFVPLHWRVEAILAKYENQLPRAITNQRMNIYLKELGQKAEIDTQIEISKTKGGTRDTEIKPKYQLITTHTARRTGATNMYLSGIPSIAIMKITGHKTESSFLRYINVTPEENAILLMNHDFFAKGRLRAV